jgi:hypothetical protein
MSRKTYLRKRSLNGHKLMVETFIRGMAEHWDSNDIHLSCDSAIARGVGESRLELLPMIDWDAFIGSRQIHELRLPPNSRHYHRYLPIPPSARQSLDEWAIEKVKMSLHHQLLTGVVIHIDPHEITSASLDELECSVVRNKIALLAPGHYWRSRIDVTAVMSRDDHSFVDGMFDQLWETRRKSHVMCLYYKYPETFVSEHYVPRGMRSFTAFLQNYRCPCQNSCDLNCHRWAVDHIVPINQAGTNVLINLQATRVDYNSARKRERPEARTVNFDHIMSDPRWKPMASSAYKMLLVKQRCNLGVLSKIEDLNRRRVRSVISRLKHAC